MPTELSKSTARRLREPNYATRYFHGHVVDIGGGPDPFWSFHEFYPLVHTVTVWEYEGCQTIDLRKGAEEKRWAGGDAQVMPGVPADTFDAVVSSHCFEHIHDPLVGLRRWVEITKPGGWLVLTFPDEDLYEQGVFPSTFNPDHKNTFTTYKPKSWSPRSVNVIDLVRDMGDAVLLQKLERIDGAHRYGWPRLDQTQTISECALELVLQKRTEADKTAGGRLPRSATRE